MATKKNTKPTYRSFIINKGYVESDHMSEMTIKCEGGSFASVSEALKTFGVDYLTYLESEGGKVGKEAGKILKSVQPTQPELPTLEQSTPDEYREEWIADRIRELMDSDCDSSGYFWVDSGSSWNYGGLADGLVIRVARGPDMIGKAVLGSLTDHEIRCFFTAYEVKVSRKEVEIVK